MPVNLGWCDGRTETYAERSCKVKFTAGDASKEVIIKQASNSIAMGSNHPIINGVVKIRSYLRTDCPIPIKPGTTKTAMLTRKGLKRKTFLEAPLVS